MARLTNRQMEVLSERVTDLLEEQHKIDNKAIKESAEYINFEITYADENIDKLKSILNAYNLAKSKSEEYDEEAKRHKKSATKIGVELRIAEENSYYIPEPKLLLEKALKTKKEQKYAGTTFNRDKTLRRVQADILLSDVQNPEELVRSLVEKLKQNGK